MYIVKLQAWCVSLTYSPLAMFWFGTSISCIFPDIPVLSLASLGAANNTFHAMPRMKWGWGGWARFGWVGTSVRTWSYDSYVHTWCYKYLWHRNLHLQLHIRFNSEWSTPTLRMWTFEELLPRLRSCQASTRGVAIDSSVATWQHPTCSDR